MVKLRYPLRWYLVPRGPLGSQPEERRERIDQIVDLSLAADNHQDADLARTYADWLIHSVRVWVALTVATAVGVAVAVVVTGRWYWLIFLGAPAGSAVGSSWRARRARRYLARVASDLAGSAEV